ncbi:MAG: ABC transporter ATP-binding protein/permease [Clostridia bacterium]|nr:ABC transporter ATP-binding protein/permease [Clostridia bacterium]
MLKLKNITKKYPIGDTTVEALRGVSLEFRENEFVSILGPSGCGKTTLLNIIGGLDRYTDGDLFINGKSTKLYRDGDWDNYRNHTIGFIFQSYNLIPHQTVLSNVELALTLSGIKAEERHKRAIEALEKVGLADQLNKKPNQMSGGQMQRVAIARALVNNPDILLADEPTGALDSETSLQIMELLKEIAKDKLVIMVTHNPELAEEYSTRIIRLLDGVVTDDTAPFSTEEETADKKPVSKKPSMSFITALSLSLNNLMTKKARTFLTSFAGSIGLIGIALILSLSNGVNAYIRQVEEETLSSYPITIEQAGMDMSGLANDLMGEEKEADDQNANKIYSQNIMTDMMSTMINGISANNLEAFKKHIEKTDAFKEYTTEIQYSYSTPMNIYTEDGVHINPNQIFTNMMAQMGTTVETSGMASSTSSPFMNTEVWNQLFDDEEYLETQYEVIAGKLPKKYNEVVLIVNRNHQISDYTLYSLGLKDQDELTEMIEKAKKGEKIEATEKTSYTFDQILKLKFKLLVNSDYFEKNDNNLWTDKTSDPIYVQKMLENAEEIKVVGILKPADSTVNTQTSGYIGYKKELMEKLINSVNDSEIVKYQKENEDINIFTGRPFENNFENLTFEQLQQYIMTLPQKEQAEYTAYIGQMKSQGKSDAEITEFFKKALSSQNTSATLESNLALMGVSDLANPTVINIYPKDFEAKDSISNLIKEYNDKAEDGEEITYTDYIGLMMSSVTTIINAIIYILIAFVSISLIVSSIMIGIITYISVLERTKEIGILRAMGASKRDISRVFNAETLIVGFVAGALGIIVTLILLIPINAIILALTDIGGLAKLPTVAAVVLIGISMLLTFIAGLFPSKVAAKKDPVTALRTE